MHYCQHPVPVSYEDYVCLPGIDGIITPLGMDTFECSRPASCKFHGTWWTPSSGARKPCDDEGLLVRI